MRINEILRKENLGKVYQIVGYTQKGEYLVKEYNGHVYLESRENFKRIEENFFLDVILGMSFEEVFSWEDIPVDTKVLVKDEEDSCVYIKRYFAEFKDGYIYTWADGKTSFTTQAKTAWKYGKLYEEQTHNVDVDSFILRVL
jgi:hypothetical protein